MDQIFFIGLVAAAFRLATPIVFAALGEAISQRAGVLNVGIEGIMLVGAFAGAWGSATTGSPWLGLAIALAAGVAAAAVHGLLCLQFRADQIVSGIALTVLGLGLSGFAYRLTLGSDRGVAIPSFSRLDLGALGELPVVGPMLFQHYLLVYVALALSPPGSARRHSRPTGAGGTQMASRHQNQDALRHGWRFCRRHLYMGAGRWGGMPMGEATQGIIAPL